MKNMFKIFKTSRSKGTYLTLVVLLAGLFVISAIPVSAQQQETVRNSFRPDGSLQYTTHYDKDGGVKIATFRQDGSLESTRHYDKYGTLVEEKTYDKNEGVLKVWAAAGEALLRRSGNLKEDAKGRPDKKNPPELDSIVDDLSSGPGMFFGQSKQDKTDTSAEAKTGIGNFLESSPEAAFAEFESVLSVFLGKDADGKPDKTVTAEQETPDREPPLSERIFGPGRKSSIDLRLAAEFLFDVSDPDKKNTPKSDSVVDDVDLLADLENADDDPVLLLFDKYDTGLIRFRPRLPLYYRRVDRIAGGGFFPSPYYDPDSITSNAESTLTEAGGGTTSTTTTTTEAEETTSTTETTTTEAEETVETVLAQIGEIAHAGNFGHCVSGAHHNDTFHTDCLAGALEISGDEQ